MKKSGFSPLPKKFFSGEYKFKTNDFFFQWCCDCMLRHVWVFKIIRGKKPEDDYVELQGTDDRLATYLRRKYKKNAILKKPKHKMK